MLPGGIYYKTDVRINYRTDYYQAVFHWEINVNQVVLF